MYVCTYVRIVYASVLSLRVRPSSSVQHVLQQHVGPMQGVPEVNNESNGQRRAEQISLAIEEEMYCTVFYSDSSMMLFVTK